MSHYSMGYNVYNHKGKTITSIVGNSSADRSIQSIDESQLEPGVVPPNYESRPDLIANLFLDDAKQFWYICLISGKYDVFEDYYVGSRINLPS